MRVVRIFNSLKSPKKFFLKIRLNLAFFFSHILTISTYMNDNNDDFIITSSIDKDKI